eukprot:TRINITY_DN5029_c0_g1_i1.p1 TRINITY_DN5029_c0_g1~~TRINITY_DN5029_c0_g1_i1.p1  ORF type:complete len:582 (+),score=128.77 TRINITY_DN5029_c0_g1_i1:34-1746(+)
MTTSVRSSKFRHVFGNPFKKTDCIDNVKMTNSAFDSNFMTCSNEYLAVQWQAGGGAFAVVPHSFKGRLATDYPLYSGHSSTINDLDFNPFYDNIIASSSEDCSIKIWRVENPGTANVTEANLTLSGHQRRCGVIQWHPTASNVLASTSADGNIKVWDTEVGTAHVDMSDHPDVIQSISWNYDGSMFATSCKDKNVRLVDPRSSTSVASTIAHDNARGSRVIFLGRKDRLASMGFSKTSERELRIWDARDMSTPVGTLALGTGAGMMMPFYDEDNSILFLCGKGDGNIRFFEMIDDSTFIYPLSEFKDTVPQRGMCALPKKSVDVFKHEIMRLYKLSGTMITPISFLVPRKGDQFQPDIFPDTRAWEPTMTAAEWFSGEQRPPKQQSMNPADRGLSAPTPSSAAPTGSSSPAVHTPTASVVRPASTSLASPIRPSAPAPAPAPAHSLTTPVPAVPAYKAPTFSASAAASERARSGASQLSAIAAQYTAVVEENDVLKQANQHLANAVRELEARQAQLLAENSALRAAAAAAPVAPAASAHAPEPVEPAEPAVDAPVEAEPAADAAPAEADL